jgi:hypothetical protein
LAHAPARIMLCYPTLPTFWFLRVACLEPLPPTLACFDRWLISEESGIKVRVFLYVSCFAFKYNTAPPLHITRCHFTCTLHYTHAIITPIYNTRPARYSTRDQTRDHSPPWSELLE